MKRLSLISFIALFALMSTAPLAFCIPFTITGEVLLNAQGTETVEINGIIDFNETPSIGSHDISFSIAYFSLQIDGENYSGSTGGYNVENYYLPPLQPGIIVPFDAFVLRNENSDFELWSIDSAVDFYHQDGSLYDKTNFLEYTELPYMMCSYSWFSGIETPLYTSPGIVTWFTLQRVGWTQPIPEPSTAIMFIFGLICTLLGKYLSCSTRENL